MLFDIYPIICLNFFWSKCEQLSHFTEHDLDLTRGSGPGATLSFKVEDDEQLAAHETMKESGKWRW